MPTERVPCKKCGASILTVTFERTEGLCMPCSQSRNRPHIPHVVDEDGFTIAYTVTPSWGRCRRVYLIDSDSEGYQVHFQAASDLPENIRPNVSERHRVYPEHPTSINRLDTTSWLSLRSYVDGLSLPVLGEFTGGFDGTHYCLRIERAMTSIEFHWWLNLPDRWLPLLDITRILAHPFASPEYDDSRPRRTEAECAAGKPTGSLLSSDDSP